MALLSFLLGLLVVFTSHISLLGFLDPNLIRGVVDLFVSGLVVGSGTEAANTFLKYTGFLKEKAKIDASLSSAELQKLNPTDSNKDNKASIRLKSTDLTENLIPLGYIKVTKPENREIFIRDDGQSVLSGTSPLTFAVRPGPNTVETQINGKPDYSFEAYVKKGETITIELKPV
jgi:hypothetical protein